MINNIGVLYANQGRLAELEAMHYQALQGYKETLGPEQLLSCLPALKIMVHLGDLFSRTARQDTAKIIYTKALAGIEAVQGPSSIWCTQLKNRLQWLQSSFEPKERQGANKGTGTTDQVS